MLTLAPQAIAAPDFLLYRDEGKLAVIFGNWADSHGGFRLEPKYLWEGNASRCTVTKTSGGVKVHWQIDIIGPDWWYVDMEDDEYGLTVIYDHSRTGNVDCGWWEDYESFVEDRGELAGIVKCLLLRSWQNPCLPEAARIARLVFGMERTVVPFGFHDFVYKLDSQDWQVREKEFAYLVNKPELCEAYLRTHAVTQTQRTMLEAIVGRHKMWCPASCLEELREKCVGEVGDGPLRNIVLYEDDGEIVEDET